MCVRRACVCVCVVSECVRECLLEAGLEGERKDVQVREESGLMRTSDVKDDMLREEEEGISEQERYLTFQHRRGKSPQDTSRHRRHPAHTACVRRAYSDGRPRPRSISHSTSRMSTGYLCLGRWW